MKRIRITDTALAAYDQAVLNDTIRLVLPARALHAWLDLPFPQGGHITASSEWEGTTTTHHVDARGHVVSLHPQPAHRDALVTFVWHARPVPAGEDILGTRAWINFGHDVAIQQVNNIRRQMAARINITRIGDVEEHFLVVGPDGDREELGERLDGDPPLG